jgi:eukaryotic-like serine/threonine-protein kinase
VADASDLRGTFQRRWTALGLAETVLDIALDATVKPDGAGAEPKTFSRPNPEDLPRISLSFSGRSEIGATPDARARADLEVLDLIGEGGMGSVHAARQRSLDRDVAIKMVRTHSVSRAASGALLREAVITGRLEHPGIVPVHALGVDDGGAPVLVMKRIEGIEWRALMSDARHPDWATRPGDRLTAHLEVLIQVCQAVHFANVRGVVHCDIKPENVMLGGFGEVYLVDWGVAMRADDEVTAARKGLVGTPAYMAPELVAGDPVTSRTDVYLLGATLHEILTGKFRHDGETLQQALLSAFCSEPYVYDAAVPEELAALANCATHRDPDKRPSSALEFKNALAGFLAHKGSVLLAEEARGRLAQLGAMLAACEGEAPPDLQRAYQLVSECRFGFTQALKEWPENPAARDGAARALVAAVELELAQGHVETGQALLGELSDVPDDLAHKVRAARRKAARERKETERLHAMAADLDANVAGRERTKGLAALSGATLAVAAYALSQPNASHIKPIGMLSFAGVLFALIITGVLIWRKRFFANAINRRLVAVMLLCGFSVVANRTIAVFLDTPAPRVFVADFLLLAAITAVAAISLLRGLWLLSLTLFAGSLACVAMPDSSPIVFALVGILIAPFTAFALWKHRVDDERARAEDIPDSELFD